MSSWQHTKAAQAVSQLATCTSLEDLLLWSRTFDSGPYTGSPTIHAITFPIYNLHSHISLPFPFQTKIIFAILILSICATRHGSLISPP
jgi:hypothetical protein